MAQGCERSSRASWISRSRAFVKILRFKRSQPSVSNELMRCVFILDTCVALSLFFEEGLNQVGIKAHFGFMGGQEKVSVRHLERTHGNGKSGNEERTVLFRGRACTTSLESFHTGLKLCINGLVCPVQSSLL